jgi:hypothetical protein
MWWRSLLALVVLAAASVAVQQLVIVPWRCNSIEGEVSRATDRIWEDQESWRAREVAERNVELILDCAERCKTDVNQAMLLGSNLSILGRHDASLAQFKDALRYDQRPELYFAQGYAQLQAGMKDEALQSFVHAGDFAGQAMLRDIPDPLLRWRAHEIVGTRIESSLARSGRLNVNNRIRKGLQTWTTNGAATLSEVPSPRNANRRAMQVTTNAANAGIRQRFAGANAPGRVRASVWVFVKRGRVGMGTGNGRLPIHNVFSTTTGRWEKLEAVNEACPARWIMIEAVDEGGAEFLIDEINVRTTVAAPPCER